MSTGPVHFEVFAIRSAAAGWALDCAMESRELAVAAAQALIDERRALAVRVTKEVMEADGGFRSFVAFTAGDAAGRGAPKGRTATAAPVCASPADLYTVHARERLGRLLGGWLRPRGVTVFELLHRPDLAEALDASGSDLQHAVQKIAIPEAQATGAPTRDMVRAFQKLADDAVERLVKDGRRKLFPTLGDDYGAAARALVDEPDARYRLGGGVAAALAGASGWRAKAERLMALAEQAPPFGPARALALAVLEPPLSEVLGARDGVSDLVGAELDLGGVMAVIARLCAGPECRALAERDPAFARALPPLGGAAGRLAGLLEFDAFDGVRTAMARRLLAELRGQRRLHPSDPEAEITLLRALATALAASAGRLLPIEDVQEAFVERSRHLVAADFVESLVSRQGGALGEVEALIRLAENVAGQINKRACARWIGALTASLRFERELRAAPDAPVAKLSALALAQRELLKAGLPEPDATTISGQLGAVGDQVEAECRLVAALAKSAGPPIERLTALLRLASGEAAPLGPAADRAKAEALRLLRQPQTRQDLAARPQALGVVRGLLAQASLAAA